MTTKALQFLPHSATGGNPYLYLACYANDKTYYSSNFYNNNTSSRGSAANLTVENGCTILGVYVDYNVTPLAYYSLTPMTVSDISKLPTGITDVSFQKSTQVGTKYDLSTVLTPSTNSITLGIIADITNFVTPISADAGNSKTSSQATACINNGSVIIGDAAVTKITRTNGAYYANHNICVSKSVINAPSSSSSWWWIIIIIVLLIIIAVAAFVGFKAYKRHKSNI